MIFLVVEHFLCCSIALYISKLSFFSEKSITLGKSVYKIQQKFRILIFGLKVDQCSIMNLRLLLCVCFQLDLQFMHLILFLMQSVCISYININCWSIDNIFPTIVWKVEYGCKMSGFFHNYVRVLRSHVLGTLLREDFI